MADLTLGKLFQLLSQCMFCGSERVEEDMEGKFSQDVIIIKCRKCGKRTLIAGEQVLEAKRKLGLLQGGKRVQYY